MSHVEAAFEASADRPDLVTLLGIMPEGLDNGGYGWIEPGEPLAWSSTRPLRLVRGFHEKPSRPDSERYRAYGWLWNSFVMVARVSALLALIKLALPDLYGAFEPVRRCLGTVGEAAAVDLFYCGLPTIDFPRSVLEARPGNLAVLPRAMWSGTTWATRRACRISEAPCMGEVLRRAEHSQHIVKVPRFWADLGLRRLPSLPPPSDFPSY
jgi:mannose-1-phosphate guanylyltransferase